MCKFDRHKCSMIILIHLTNHLTGVVGFLNICLFYVKETVRLWTLSHIMENCGYPIPVIYMIVVLFIFGHGIPRVKWVIGIQLYRSEISTSKVRGFLFVCLFAISSMLTHEGVGLLVQELGLLLKVLYLIPLPWFTRATCLSQEISPIGKYCGDSLVIKKKCLLCWIFTFFLILNCMLTCYFFLFTAKHGSKWTEELGKYWWQEVFFHGRWVIL